MKVILIDDEPIALELLSRMLSFYEDVDIVGSYANPFDALGEIGKTQPDAIFLDIEMGSINGLEFAEVLIEKLATVKIVFVTAYSQYAVDAFEVNAIDYLLKPIQEKRLTKTIERLKEEIGGNLKPDIFDNKLKVISFGGFQVLDSMDNPLAWRTQKSRELFAYLWSKKDRAVSKMSIVEDIFPDRDFDKTITLLHTTIYQLRKSLERLGYPNGIIYFNDSYQLDLPIESDIEKLNKVLDHKEYNHKEIKEILEIYKGDFLEEEGYHWAIEIQQRYRDIVFNILEKFTKNELKKGRLSSIMKFCLDKIYELDPFNEDVAKMLIHYYGRQSRRASLERFFNGYEENLWNEMNLKPMKSTIELYKKYLGLT